MSKIASDLSRADGRQILNFAASKGASNGLIQGNNISGRSLVFGLMLASEEEKVKPILTLDLEIAI